MPVCAAGFGAGAKVVGLRASSNLLPQPRAAGIQVTALPHEKDDRGAEVSETSHSFRQTTAKRLGNLEVLPAISVPILGIACFAGERGPQTANIQIFTEPWQETENDTP